MTSRRIFPEKSHGMHRCRLCRLKCLPYLLGALPGAAMSMVASRSTQEHDCTTHACMCVSSSGRPTQSKLSPSSCSSSMSSAAPVVTHCHPHACQHCHTASLLPTNNNEQQSVPCTAKGAHIQFLARFSCTRFSTAQLRYAEQIQVVSPARQERVRSRAHHQRAAEHLHRLRQPLHFRNHLQPHRHHLPARRSPR